MIFRLKAHFDYFINPERHDSFLIYEQGVRQLESAIFADILPIVANGAELAEIIQVLRPNYAIPKILEAVYQLYNAGYLTRDADPKSPQTDQRYWDAVGLNPQGLATTSVSIHSLLNLEPDLLTTPFQQLNLLVTLGISSESVLDIWLTDDYLRPELDCYHQQAEKPWLLVKPVGQLLWVGPLFIPGETACWDCLAQRLRLNRSLESWISQQTGQSLPQASLRSTVHIALNMAATQVVNYLAGEANPLLCNRIITCDTQTLTTQTHLIIKRPQCPACGQSVAAPMPITNLNSNPMHALDLGYRHQSATTTLETYQYHLSPVTGLVSRLIPIPAAPGIHVYSAGHSSPMPIKTWDDFIVHQRNQASGKGTTDLQAKVSGLCEALERYSSCYSGDEFYQIASYQELGDTAVHPKDLLNFSDAQYTNRQAWNQKLGNKPNYFIPEPYLDHLPLAWTPVWSLSQHQWQQVPTSYCYKYAPAELGWLYCRGDSNGNAAGNSLEEAILQGFLELIERDAVAIWWYNKIQRPGVSLTGIDDPFIDRMQHYYRNLGREFWLLDLTHDLGIPTFVALSRQINSQQNWMNYGLGCHLNAKIAAIRALTEMNQLLPHILKQVEREDRRIESSPDAANALFPKLSHLGLDASPYLFPDPNLPLQTITNYSVPEWENLGDCLGFCLSQCQQLGLELLVHNLTRPDVGLPVVKVIVPGLRHFWPRFGPGRLYHVPVQLGWLENPFKEKQLNHVLLE